MKLKVYLGAAALVLFSSVLFALDPQQKEMTAEEKAAMDAYMKAAMPGDAHKKLAEMAGTWNATVKVWSAPGAEPAVSTGTSVNTSVLGGRWMREEFDGTFMGMPFSGVGYTGYDNVLKQYVSTWMDSMSTGVMISNGTAGSDNTYSYTSTVSDAMTGKPSQATTKITVVDKDKHVMEMFGPAPDGKVYKMMEIAYTRKK